METVKNVSTSATEVKLTSENFEITADNKLVINKEEILSLIKESQPIKNDLLIY